MSDETQLRSPEIVREEAEAAKSKGPLAWFARNSVAANVLMVILVVGGLVNLGQIKQEVFPAFDLDLVVARMTYPGASPEEVERGSLLAVEEAVRGLNGVKEVTSTARENLGVASVILKRGEDSKQKLNEIKAAIDRITSFPADMERPEVFLASTQWEVISFVLHGPQDEATLRALAEEARDKLLQDKRVSVVDFAGARDYEISIEISQEKLRQYSLTLDQIAQLIRRSTLELPGGGVKTGSGEVLIRTTERRLYGHEFESIALISRPDGTTVTVGDLVSEPVRDGFTENDQITSYEGQPAIMIRVFRTGDEKPLHVATAVKELVAEMQKTLPKGVEIDTWLDFSQMYDQRIDLLTRNALAGLVLVILVLGLFLEIKLAFWVTMGIPISFAGAFLFLPSTNVSLNMISLFAFIQVLGMVVDDAIVVGEAAYMRRQQGMKPMEAAIAGVKEVAVPVCFAIITTIVMYTPMLYMPGIMGKFMGVIPVVVITVLLLSLVESLLVLPAHLAHSKAMPKKGPFGWIAAKQQSFSNAFESLVKRRYIPFLRFAVKYRYITMCVGLATLVASMGLLLGGRIRRIDMPDIDSDVVIAAARLPYGTSVKRAQRVEAEMNRAAEALFDKYGGRNAVAVGKYSQIGNWAMTARSDLTGAALYDKGAHLVEVAIYMVPSSKRPIRAAAFAKEWRESLGDTVGLETLSFNYAMGPGSGPPVHVDLSHKDYEILKTAAAELALSLEEYEGTYDINDGYEEGKEQIDFELSPEARSLGVTEASLAIQLRSAFFGAEAVRQQRGRDEVRTYVRLPKKERESEFHIEEFMLRTPSGGEIPLSRAAITRRGVSFTQIRRNNGQRVLSVTSMVDPEAADAKSVVARVVTEQLPKLMSKYPGMTYTMGGAEKEMAEANDGLITGFLFALLGVYALLAVAFRSYSQPLLIMLAIPFGFVGALWGHYIMGHDFSMMSMMGVVALSGVVVNDSLILIVAINENRKNGFTLIDSITRGGQRRFRPILLTSLTTFFGLMPMLLETEVQAQFLAPMAVSLGFGVMAATAITLLIVPVAYHILQDAKGTMHQLGELAGFIEAKPVTPSADELKPSHELPESPS